MTIKDMQKEVDEWISQYKVGYYPPLAIITQSVEELGELAREVNNRYGPRIKKSPSDTAEIGEEITDVIFAMICLANSQGINLEEKWKKKMEKCYGRDDNRWEKIENKHWEQEHFEKLNNANSYDEILNVAMDILQKMPQPVSQVCGPLTSGGKGSILANADCFRKTILKLGNQSHNIFDQVPFEKAIQKIRANQSHLSQEESNTLLLEGFYLPIFKSGFIKKLFFISGWESSQGARWEHEKAKEFGIEIIYLEENF
ncbi:nucleotide pyrophosphohydrolase [Candidatus Pacearchaeota archaeon]|nr:nucleotide pyrophosphohydrolase [Candidatus Pacearchaeota archaeon]